MMSKWILAAAFAVGVLVVGWVALGFVGASWLPLTVTAVIGAVYLLGARELWQFRAATRAWRGALDELAQPPATLDAWLERLPPALRNPVRLRIEGERGALPGPALTPYLVGLLVMLGMLGTFLGMVATFQGAVFALEGSSNLAAIRSALAAPIRGLGLAFGTSVAGVATSAMLGLMSAVSRRERMELGRRLDSRIAGVLRPFSAAHQRQEGYEALKAQARALPQVVTTLQSAMERIEARSRELDQQLSQRQERFQAEVAQAYTALAQSVGASLQESLAGAARAAGDTIRPVVEDAMTQVVQEARRTHERLAESAQAQVEALSRRFDASAQAVSEHWIAALQRHEQTSGELAIHTREALASFAQSFEQRSTAVLDAMEASQARAQSAQALAGQQRLQAWTASLQQMAGELQAQWRRMGEETLAQQQAVCARLEQTAGTVAGRTAEEAGRALDRVAGLLAQSEELVRSRTQAEGAWLREQGERMDRLAQLWRTELQALREQEDERGQAAVQRLDELQAAVTRHLGTLGAALEAPITRLLHTASEVPQAAAGVIAQLRGEMSRVAERDNLALQERAGLLERLGALLDAVTRASGEQRSATEAMVASASTVLQQAGARFAQALDAQAAEGRDAAAHVAGSAVELASLAEAFGHGVQLFQASSDKLTETLDRIEASLTRSTARSDEQLAYYVAQAREVIDLSIASQQGLVENLRQLQGAQPAALAEAGR